MDASTLRFIMELADLLGKAPCIPVIATIQIIKYFPRNLAILLNEYEEKN